MVSTGHKVETWERLGYESFGAWRRACEKARRDAKKVAPPAPPAVKWHPPQISGLDEIRSASSTLTAPAPTSFDRHDEADPGGKLPGRMREDVLFTPRGRREHTFKHTSPGGTTRCEQYSSPAGVQPAWQERVACLERLRSARHHTTITGRDERKASQKRALWVLLDGEAVQGPARCPAVLSEHITAKVWLHSGYGDTCRECEACILRAQIRKKRQPRGEVVPCRVKLARLGYTNTEQDMMYDQLM